MKVITVIVHRNTPDLVEKQVKQILAMPLPEGVTNGIMVVSAGSDYDKEFGGTRDSVLWYPDPDFRGKCYAHNMGLRYLKKDYDYYWFNHPDLDFSVDPKCLHKLVTCMDANPEIAVLSPVLSTEYMGKNLKTSKGWHKVATVDYLSLLIRKSCVHTLGFLNEEFQYAWGAIVEYSYLVHKLGWCIAFCEDAHAIHLGGSTYGVKGTKTISREAYISRARAFCRSYFPKTYGDDWFIKFFEVLPEEAKRIRYHGTSDATLTSSPSNNLDRNPYWIKRTNWEIR